MVAQTSSLGDEYRFHPEDDLEHGDCLPEETNLSSGSYIHPPSPSHSHLYGVFPPDERAYDQGDTYLSAGGNAPMELEFEIAGSEGDAPQHRSSTGQPDDAGQSSTQTQLDVLPPNDAIPMPASLPPKAPASRFVPFYLDTQRFNMVSH
eukprot:501065-Pyramimonas_sp.AAC.1